MVGDACSKLLITIRSHDLHVDNIRGDVGEIASYHKTMRGTSFPPSLVPTSCASFGFSLAFCFVFSVMLWPSVFIGLLCSMTKTT